MKNNMKIEWGKKVNCPACALPFYSMQKTSLVCPNCGNNFELSELFSKKGTSIAMDEVVESDEKIALSGFGFMEDDDVDLAEENDDISDGEVIDDIKLVDEE